MTDLDQLIHGMQQMTAHATQLGSARLNPGQHEQVRAEMMQKAWPAYQALNQALEHLARRYYPELFQSLGDTE